MKHNGSCLCGGVRYALRGDLGPVTLCHCRQCRKAQGGAAVAAAPVKAAEFEIVSGAELLRAFESSPGKERVFCSRCGSPLYSRRAAEPDFLRLRLGTLDTPVGAKPAAHIWVGNKADWDDICDGVPQYAAYEPARDVAPPR
ncbi:MAG: GFA family protein [Rhodocyclaceae bacterium]|nr:GFA family protein [Rhodocyclaceae bacterium]